MKIFMLSFLVVILNACHPFAMFRPPAIKTKSSGIISHLSHNKVDIAVDAYGIPFIKGNSIDDVVYGLGYMHARDRLFQLDLLRHAALGKTSELFGARGMSYDRKLRLLTYRLDEQVERLSKKERSFLDTYVRGVNDGATQRGRSAEHFLLGVRFEEFSIRDVIAIARLQSWQLGADLASEVTRLKIARSNWPLDAKNELLSATDDRGSAIIKGYVHPVNKGKVIMPSYLRNSTPPIKEKDIESNGEDFGQPSGGASNAWVVHGSSSRDGHAILMNDPHLMHNWPSNFYLATLMTNDFWATGATFPGLPCILIGASKNLSWGVTASYLNTQDLVLLDIDKNDESAYWVNGKKTAFVEWPQQFCLNKKNMCVTEMNYLSMFGPVINHNLDNWIDKGDVFACY
jgi:penicillin amidase